MSEPFENLEELAHRAVACKHWRWMPGMLVVYPPSVSAHLESKEGPFSGLKVTVCFRHTERDEEPYTGTRPDLTDPATIGCLFALVREAHGDPEIVVSKYEYSDGWTIGTQLEWEGIHSLSGSDGSIWGCSEAEVLVRALEAAP